MDYAPVTGQKGSFRNANPDLKAEAYPQLGFLREARHRSLFTRLTRLFLVEYYHTAVLTAKPLP